MGWHVEAPSKAESCRRRASPPTRKRIAVSPTPPRLHSAEDLLHIHTWRRNEQKPKSSRGRRKSKAVLKKSWGSIKKEASTILYVRDDAQHANVTTDRLSAKHFQIALCRRILIQRFELIVSKDLSIFGATLLSHDLQSLSLFLQNRASGTLREHISAPFCVIHSTEHPYAIKLT